MGIQMPNAVRARPLLTSKFAFNVPVNSVQIGSGTDGLDGASTLLRPLSTATSVLVPLVHAPSHNRHLAGPTLQPTFGGTLTETDISGAHPPCNRHFSSPSLLDGGVGRHGIPCTEEALCVVYAIHIVRRPASHHHHLAHHRLREHGTAVRAGYEPVIGFAGPKLTAHAG